MNTSNIVFLKSTDDSMLDTLQKMSGITHKSFRESKTVTDDKERIFFRNQSTVSYTITTKEMPVISYNDMAFIPERNSIVFRAGDSPIWNRNEFILPMSWRLFSNTIVHAGHDYSLQTIPTLSSALDFDIRKNQPDFQNMLDKRILQAYFSKTAREQYRKAYYTDADGSIMSDADFQIGKLDPDVYSNEIMSIIDAYVAMRQGTYKRRNDEDDEYDDDFDLPDANFGGNNPLDVVPPSEDNPEQTEMNNRAALEAEEYSKKIYAKGTISRDDLVTRAGQATHAIDKVLRTVYVNIKHAMERDTKHFMVMKGNLCGLDGEVYVLKPNNSATLDELNKAIHDKSLRVYSAEDLKAEDLTTYHFTDAFYRFLIREDSWNDIANGIFEEQMGKEMTMDVSMQ